MYFLELLRELSEDKLNVKTYYYNYCCYYIRLFNVCFSSDDVSNTEKLKNTKEHIEEKSSIISPPR